MGGRGWLLTDWYVVITERTRKTKLNSGWQKAETSIRKLGFETFFPPKSLGPCALLVKFDIYEDPWQAILHAPGVKTLVMDGIVPWPIAITREEMKRIRHELEQEAAFILCHGRRRRLKGSKSMGCLRVGQPSSWHTSKTQNGMWLRRAERLVTQARNTNY
ncbi:MAG: hypothetical protein KGL39_41185 [Patescibacteria group bacterium]|nr:hypothetical protein [Patescibacteria group bacterium]